MNPNYTTRMENTAMVSIYMQRINSATDICPSPFQLYIYLFVVIHLESLLLVVLRTQSLATVVDLLMSSFPCPLHTNPLNSWTLTNTALLF